MGISLASFHHLAAGIAEDLKDPVLPVLVGQGSHLHPLEGDDALGGVLGGVLEVVEATVVEDKPASLPILPVSALQGSMFIFIITLWDRLLRIRNLSVD